MSIDPLFIFAPLQRELTRWQAAGHHATFWIRDDDATRMSPEFERLLTLQKKYSLPMAISVIPKWCGLQLPRIIRDRPDMIVLQHGWSHENHASQPGQHSEFAENRSPDEIQQDLIMGRTRLEILYGDQFIPGFVPPWNHIAPVHMPLFRDYQFISGRNCMEGMAGMKTLHVHLDVLRWGDRPRFRGKRKIIRELCKELRGRRESGKNAPLGIQLHHLVMDRASWRFTDQLIGTLAAHSAAQFLDIRQAIFAANAVEAQKSQKSDQNVLAFRQKIA